MTRDELLDELAQVRGEVAAYFAALPLEELYRQAPGSWAPIDDLRHITVSVGKVTRAFGLPADALAGRFGLREGPARTRDQVATVAYRGLREGGKATGDLVPDPVPEEGRTAAFRDACLAEWSAAAAAFEAALAAWPDEALDRHQLPHPFLGMFSLREWVDFNILHARHHVAVAERRLGRGEGAGPRSEVGPPAPWAG